MQLQRRLAISGVFVMGLCAIPPGLGLPWGEVLEAAPWFGSYSSWGSDGQDGRSGRDGRAGRDGFSQTIYADGNSLNLDLAGGNGDDGEDGEHGEDAVCPIYWRQPEQNLQGADGGHGGDGGMGGDGGDGGDLTIFYRQSQDLKNIFVNNLGGQAGISGRGGYGGEGCDCYDEAWQVEVCEWEEVEGAEGETPTREQKCETKTYYCRDGGDGRPGDDGAIARDGAVGNVTLVQNLTAIPMDNPSGVVTVGDLQRSPVTLSKNIWRSQSGLLSKLASGSKVPNDYREYVEFWQVPISLNWQSSQSIQTFSGAQFQFTLGDRRDLAVSQGGSLWLDYDVMQQGNAYKVTVTRAIAASDATSLVRQGLTGTGRELQLKIADLSAHPDWLDTHFRVIYRTRNPNPEFRQGYTYTTRYDGVVDGLNVQQNQREFTLNLGALPIEPQYLKQGTAIELEVIAERTFASHSTDQTIRWTGVVP